MSLIESALEKMRRDSSAARGEKTPVASREIVARSDTEPQEWPIESRRSQPRRIEVDWTFVRAAGYAPEETQARHFANQYRQIKRPLIEKAFAPDSAPEARLIVLTSAVPGDGKTFTAINLALSMARERDISILLVDADVPRSRITEIFGLRSAPGLVDALVNESTDIEACIEHTDIAGLEVLPAGNAVDDATELLASARMGQVMARLLTNYPRRLVLFDSAPLLGSNEARALIKIPGQIVLVVRAGVTPRRAVLDAVTHLDEKKLQGMILNGAMTARGSGYYYGYSSYGSLGKAKDAAS